MPSLVRTVKTSNFTLEVNFLLEGEKNKKDG